MQIIVLDYLNLKPFDNQLFLMIIKDIISIMTKIQSNLSFDLLHVMYLINYISNYSNNLHIRLPKQISLIKLKYIELINHQFPSMLHLHVKVLQPNSLRIFQRRNMGKGQICNHLHYSVLSFLSILILNHLLMVVITLDNLHNLVLFFFVQLPILYVHLMWRI